MMWKLPKILFVFSSTIFLQQILPVTGDVTPDPVQGTVTGSILTCPGDKAPRSPLCKSTTGSDTKIGCYLSTTAPKSLQCGDGFVPINSTCVNGAFAGATVPCPKPIPTKPGTPFVNSTNNLNSFVCPDNLFPAAPSCERVELKAAAVTGGCSLFNNGIVFQCPSGFTPTNTTCIDEGHAPFTAFCA